MTPLVFLLPFWMLFEVGQLIVGERYLGVRQIERGDDPRLRGPGEFVSFVWSAGILLYWAWMAVMLLQGAGSTQIIAMMGVTLVGFGLRRSCGLKWVLIVLTFEGAIRIGMLLSLVGLVWRRL